MKQICAITIAAVLALAGAVFFWRRRTDQA